MGRDSIRAEETPMDTPRRMSGELISMKDFLSANHVSLAVMQKQLYETAQMHKNGSSVLQTPNSNQNNFKPNAFGPLAIASEKFENKNTINR